MKKQPVLIVLIGGVILLLGWAAIHYFIAGTPVAEPVRGQQEEVHGRPLTEQDPDDSLQPAIADPGLAKPQEEKLGSQQFIPDKDIESLNNVDNTRFNLSNHTYTIEKEEKKSFEIMPGVNLKSRRIHVEIDEEAKEWIEIERSPSNSNSDYQILLKKKF
ncbi:hypothetical protein [Sporomusa termitida]|uniref:hypothetical protein n=1 Tax=Sporomusa termitida TaxID=2377 RepID=UPI001185EB43|nr:hypothetical protein [Sporomusa termitida]